MQPDPSPFPIDSRLTRAAAALMAAAGLIHLSVAPQHWSHARVHGVVLGLIGILQVAWAIGFWRKPSVWLSRLGLVTGVGLIALWAITRVSPAPFGHGPEAVDLLGVISKLLEALAVTALVAGTAEVKRQAPALLGLVLVAVVGAWAASSVGAGAEAFCPLHGDESVDHSQHHAGEHNHAEHHQSGEHHGH